MKKITINMINAHECDIKIDNRKPNRHYVDSKKKMSMKEFILLALANELNMEPVEVFQANFAQLWSEDDENTLMDLAKGMEE